MSSPLRPLLLTAVGFGSWPIIARYFDVKGPWVGVIIMCSTSLTLLCYQRGSLGTPPTKFAIAMLSS